MIKGSIPALVTPFKNGELDLVTLKKLVEWHIAEGSTGLVPVGTTGETSTLSHDEHRRVVELCVATARGRVPVVAGAGSTAICADLGARTIREEIDAMKVLGIDPIHLGVVEFDGQRARPALDHHAERIADQDQVDAVVVQHPSEAGVVTGQYAEAFTVVFQGFQRL